MKKSSFASATRLLISLAVAVSLSILPGPLGAVLNMAGINVVHGAWTQTPYNPYWVPAGPETNTERVSVFVTPSLELTGLLTNTIDFGDWPLTTSDKEALALSFNSYFLSISQGSKQMAYLAPPTACAASGSACDTQGWVRVVNSQSSSIFNFYTWLNTWNACPTGGGTDCTPGSAFRQGLSSSPLSLNPYQASTPQDFAVLRNIYDSIYSPVPYMPSVPFDWMTVSHCYTPLGSSSCVSSGTSLTLHNVLRNDIFWQDGSQVTAWDVAFSYASLMRRTAVQALGLSAVISSITVLSATQFDFNLISSGPSTVQAVGGLSIIPGHLWSACASTWSSVTSGATPTTITPTSGGCFDTTAAMAGLTFDPLNSRILIGSGGFECQNTGADIGAAVGALGSGCSNTDTGSAATSYTFTRYGCQIAGAASPTCVSPAASPSSLYFRSASNLALYIWSGMTGNSTIDFANLSTAVGCAQPAESSFSSSAACSRWQQGIGNPSGDGVSCCIVGSIQLAIFRRFYTTDWTAPFVFPPTNLTMPGVDTFPPVLYEGALTMNPAAASGIPACNTAGNTFNNGAGYNC